MRILALLAGATLLLALSACSVVQSGPVWKVDRWDRTVAIGDAIYHVTDDTRLFGADGSPISLNAVPSAADPGVGVRHLARAEVSFRAHRDGGRLLLDSLWVLPVRSRDARPTAW